MSMPMSSANPLRELFASRHDKSEQASYFDVSILLIAVALLSIGLIVVTSASMPVAANPFYFAVRHGIYIVLSIIAALIVMQIPMHWWRISNPWLLLFAVALLVAVLLVGRNVNGSTRWLALGPITIQAAEPAKLFFFC